MSHQRIIDFSSAARGRGEARFFESLENGTDYLCVRAPESLSGVGCLTIRLGFPVIMGSPYEVADSDRYLNVDDDVIGGPVTINLPPAAESVNRELSIKKLGSSGIVTVDPSGSETIDDQATMDIVFQYDAMQLFCDGVAWWIH